jgi:hypothetical protein
MYISEGERQVSCGGEQILVGERLVVNDDRILVYTIDSTFGKYAQRGDLNFEVPGDSDHVPY